EARQRASARLARAIDSERTPEPAVVERPSRVGVSRWAPKRPAHVALASLAFVAVAAAAFFISAPWKDSPGFLSRSEAALPKAGTRHVKMLTRSTWTRASCTVTYSQLEVWIDETPPNTYRVLLNDLPPEAVKADPRTRGCFSGRASEIGGTYDSPLTLRFV